MSYATRLAPLLACMFLSVSANATDTGGLKAGIFEPAREAPDFSVRGSDGTTLTLSRYRGKVVLLGFGYTSCPNVCPVTLAILAAAHRKLGPQGSDVQVIYLTVDPERDSAEKLKTYLASFDRSFVGGTGTVQQMAAVREDYGVTAEKRGTGPNYAVVHSSYIYLITRQGQLRALMPFGHSADDYVHDISMMLN